MISESGRKGLRTWVEVDTGAILRNFSAFRKIVPKDTKMMAVVKSNAYGHSLIDFSKTVEKIGVDSLGVDSVVEAQALRREGITIPILVFGYTLPELVADAVKNDIALTVSSFEALHSFLELKIAGKIKIHIEVDTGMHRQGFLESEREKLVASRLVYARIACTPRLVIC